MKTQEKHDKHFSCEFFPPKTDKGMGNLLFAANTLKTELNPEYFSVTFGAGGSTRENTFNAVTQVAQSTGCQVAPHLSCIGSSKQQIKDILDNYKQQGIKRLVTLRGNMPSGEILHSDFNYANELIRFIRDQYSDHFHIEVAAYPECHPQSKNSNQDIKYFKNKINAGANSAITQYFYNIDSYFYFIDSCEKAGIDIPIVPGIMPITNYTNLARFSDMCGAEIPRWLRQKLEAYADDTAAIKDFGAEYISIMCEKLLAMGAPGLHFYSMNQAEATLRIWNNISKKL